MAVLGVLVIGSIVEIHAQSAPYRRMTDQGYAQLATRVVDSNNQSGARLAAVISAAPTIPNQPLPNTARGEVQQGLDAALAATSDEARQARQLTPPSTSDDVASQFTAIIDERAAAVASVVSTVDQLLGMAPLPIAGGPTTTTSTSAHPSAVISESQASRQLAAAGTRIEHADRAYATWRARLRRGQVPDAGSIRMPASVWAPAGGSLGSAQLGNTAALLDASVALLPFHQMVITAVGLAPPAVPSATPNNPAGSGTIATSCNPPNPTSTVAGPTPTVLPPTGSVTPLVTVTNCGTVSEENVAVTETLRLADGPGAPAPPAGAAGSSARTTVSALSGQSQALPFPGLTVAGGHLYLLTVTLVAPAGQQNPAGTSQQFLLQIVG
ncbi:MAG TPA: hypothetical protein VG205_10800 [Acidimicrobiales bacterium]|nr:hypothetical protein [Acidimicrobiales bacterium]